MATTITDECINCGACEPECPNTAIYQGGIEYDALDGSKQAAISDDFFYIVPSKCTECVGFFDTEACAAVCPVDCCVPDPEIPETEDVLFARAKEISPDQDFPEDFPSRFKVKDEPEQEDEAAPGDAPAAAGTDGGAVAMAMSPEDAVAAQIPSPHDWPVPLTCFRCSGGFTAPFQFIRPGTVLHCPHCGSSYVPRTDMYQPILERLNAFYEAYGKSLDELKERRQNELDRFEAGMQKSFAQLAGDVGKLTQAAELAGGPARTRGTFTG
jgi:ferredoxin